MAEGASGIESETKSRPRNTDISSYPVVMDVPMVAELLLTDLNQIRKWASSGVLPAHRIPGTRRYRFIRDEILQWVTSLPGAVPPSEEAAEEVPEQAAEEAAAQPEPVQAGE